jgi:hypothetical protein
MAQPIGVPVDELSRLKHAADLSGISLVGSNIRWRATVGVPQGTRLTFDKPGCGRVYNSLLETIGNTPLVRIGQLAHLVAALGHFGDAEQAAQAIKELLNVKPGFSLNFAREHLFYLKRPEQLATYLDGLRKAGVSVCPGTLGGVAELAQHQPN